jgi:hypothetical protein
MQISKCCIFAQIPLHECDTLYHDPVVIVRSVDILRKQAKVRMLHRGCCHRTNVTACSDVAPGSFLRIAHNVAKSCTASFAVIITHVVVDIIDLIAIHVIFVNVTNATIISTHSLSFR